MTDDERMALDDAEAAEVQAQMMREKKMALTVAVRALDASPGDLEWAKALVRAARALVEEWS